MPWWIGIDEAGYGPNFGPFVQATVAIRCDSPTFDGWDLWQAILCKVNRREKNRFWVDDSKAVYGSTSDGFSRLETVVLASWTLENAVPCATLGDWLTRLQPHYNPFDHADEFDHVPTEPLPREGAQSSVDEIIVKWTSAAVTWGESQARVVPPKAFNAAIDASDSKASVVTDGVIDLLKGHVARLPDDEDLHVHVDRLGGRQYYAALLQEVFPDHWVQTVVEKPAASIYRLEQGSRKVEVTFQPKADGCYFAVALASMRAKYLREIWMGQFNRFWAKHLPELVPTAGYPLDAERFWLEIQPVVERLQLPKERVWRKR